MRATAAQHFRARDLSQEAFIAVFGVVPSLGERQYLQAVGCLESTYGGGWKGAGVGSNNMGAIQGGRPPCNPNTEFESGDKHEDGSRYIWCYKKYPTPLDGWIDLVRVLYQKRPGVRTFAGNNEFMMAVAEQRRTKYFEAKLEVYQKGIDSCLRELSTVLGEPYSPKAQAAGDLGSPASPSLQLPPTIRFGARGGHVKQWQAIIGVKIDGIFGPITMTATRKWQSEHGLKPDAIVGPLTWQKALA